MKPPRAAAAAPAAALASTLVLLLAVTAPSSVAAADGTFARVLIRWFEARDTQTKTLKLHTPPKNTRKKCSGRAAHVVAVANNVPRRRLRQEEQQRHRLQLRGRLRQHARRQRVDEEEEQRDAAGGVLDGACNHHHQARRRHIAALRVQALPERHGLQRRPALDGAAVLQSRTTSVQPVDRDRRAGVQ